MKIFTQVNRSQGMIRTLVGLKSRITTFLPLLTMVILLMVGSGNAWGGTLYGKTAVKDGKGGKAKVEIYSRYRPNHVQDDKETTGSDYVSVNLTVFSARWGFCKFYATAFTGYTFDGWYDKNNSFVSNDSPYQTSDTGGDRTDQFYAKFRAHTYTIKFDKNSSDATGQMGSLDCTYDKDKTLSTNTFTRTGYTFAGWSTTANGKVAYTNEQSVKNLTADDNGEVTLYAKWTANTYKVRFNGNGNSGGSMSDQTMTCHQAANLTANAYTRSYTVTFNANGGECATPSATANYGFGGWNTQANGQGTSYTNGQSVTNLSYTKDTIVNLYAKWTGGTITLPVATKTGKVLDGWYIINGTDTTYAGPKNSSYKPSATVTLKALWADIAEPKYTWTGDTIYHVGDEDLDLDALWASNNDEVAKSFTLVSFTPSGTNNDGAPTTTSLSGSTLSLGQAGEVKIKVTQPASTSFYAGIAELTLTINKHENIILVKGEQSYRNEIDINWYDNEFTFAATNTDYTNCPIQIEQIAGKNIATYWPDQHAVYSANVSGEAVWQVTQAENYYYESDTTFFAIDVRLAAEVVCYVVNDPNEHSFSTDINDFSGHFDSPIAVSAPVKSLSFQAKRNGSDYFVAQYSTDNGGSWKDIVSPDLSTSYDNYGPYNLTVHNITHIRFGAKTGGTFKKWYKDIKLSRFTYLNLSDDTLTFDKKNTNAPLYCGDAVSKTFTIDWSMPTNGTVINIASNNPKFTVSPAIIENTGCDDGQNEITVTYSSDEVGTFEDKIVISNEVSYKEIAVSGTTIRRPQTITWSTEDETFVEGDEITASAVGAVTMSVSGDGAAYVEVSGNKATINELDGELSSVTAVLKASAAETEVYNAKDSIRTITITNKTKQSISWSQDFAHYKTTDEQLVETLTATASSGLKVYYVLSEEVDGLTLSHNADSTVWTLTHSNKECGGVTLIAKQDGNSEYAAASSVSLPVRVFDPTKKCPIEDALIVSSNPTNGLKSSSNALFYDIYIPDAIRISAKRTKSNKIYLTANGLQVDVLDKDQKKIGDGWHYGADVINQSMEEVIDLKDNKYKDARYLRITSESSNGYDITSLSVHRRRYCRIADNKTSLSFTATTNSASNEQAIDVQYANYPLMVECSNTKFTFSPTDMFGDCGSYGVQTVLVTYHAGATAGDDSGELYIKDNTGDTLQTITLSATINKSSQTITSHNVASSYKTTDEVTLTAATSSGLSNFEYIISDDKVAQVNGSKLTFLKEGHFDLTIREPGNAGIDAVEVTISNIEVKKVTPTITGPAIAIVTLPAMLENVPVGAYTAEDDKGTEVTGTFTWNGTPLKMVEGTRYHSITFTPDQPEGKDWYDSKTFDLSVTAVKGAQAIDWSSFPDESSQACSKATSFNATASSGLTVTFTTSDKEIATIVNGNELHVLKAGTVTIYADQEGDDDYAAAEQVSKTITLTTETPVIATMPKADTIYVSQALSASQFHDWSATVNEEAIEGSFAWNNPNILPEEGKRTYKATFTGSPAAWYETVEVDVEIVCRRYPQEVTWDYEGGTINVNDVISFSGAESSVEQPIHYLTSDLSIAEVDEAHGNKLIVHGKGTIEVIARPEENAIYEATEQRRTLTILPLTTTVTANPAAAEDLTYGQTLSATEVVGGTVKGSDNAELQGTWSWNNGAEELNAGQGQVRGVTFTPTDSHWYATATSTATVNVNKANPEVTPQASAITYGQPISASSLTTKTGNVDGSWSWAVDATQVLNAGVHNLTANFTSNNANYNNLSNVAVTLTVNKANPSVTPQASAITYGQPISASSLTTKTGNVDGSWSWAVDATQVLSVGNHDLKANFSSNDANYNNLSNVDVTLTVNKIEKLNVDVPLSFCAGGSETFHGRTYTEAGSDVIEATGATRDTVYNVTVTILQPTVGADSKTITVGAEETWNGTDLSGYAVGSHSVVAVLTNAAGCDSTVTLTLTVNPLINEFTNATGDGDWNNNANWSSGAKPTEDAPNVIIQETLTIDENITVGDLTIEKGATVLIVTGGTLTVTGETEYREEGYGDIHVKDDGNLVFENTADFKVNDFILDAKLGDGTTAREGASGQVENPGKMEIKGDAYFELALDPSGECSQGWYTFTVPFQVNALTGISRYHEGNLISITYNRNYALMVYDEAARATGGKGWNYFKGTLQPGICYTITIDDVDNVYRFKKTNDGAFNTAMTQSLHYTEGDGNGNLRGWNGLGNGTLQHINLGEVMGVDYVQIYDHGQNRYIPSALSEFTYVVGSAFFVQSPETKPEMTYVAATPAESGILRVAKRHEATKDICLTLTKDGDEYLSDRMYVGASEDAQDSYEIGHDLAKMGTPTEAKVAQIWANAYGLKLCDVEMPLVNNSANCEINLYAPQAGSYTLDVERAPENTMLYLTYNGRAIWNLTYSPYVFDLTKGTTEGYGLKMYVMQIATDLEQSGFSDQNSVRKVLIDDVIYIVTQEGKMYDITGKSVKY